MDGKQSAATAFAELNSELTDLEGALVIFGVVLLIVVGLGLFGSPLDVAGCGPPHWKQ